MARRLAVPTDPIQLLHDGEPIVAQRGEPIAAALVAADRIVLGRGPKLHRPRGPYCFRGACDGCLARVDGEPNVMTCLRPALGGENVETQNVVGSRDVDLLRTADFLFPQGVDHHRLLAGVRGVSSLVQRVARRVAGLGRLPELEPEIRRAQRLETPVLIVGGGAAGLSAARVLGAKALLADEALELGGSTRALQPARAATLVARAERAGTRLLARTSVLGLFRETDSERPRAVLIGPDTTYMVEPELVLLGTGRHDPVAVFENNDLPGVLSARAALMLLGHGVLPAERVLVLGQGRFADAFVRTCGARVNVVQASPAELVAAVGRKRVRGALLRSDPEPRRARVSAIVIDGAGAPAHELALQAGAGVDFDPARGYVPRRDSRGRAAPRVFVAGAAADSPEPSDQDGERVARFMLEELG